MCKLLADYFLSVSDIKNLLKFAWVASWKSMYSNRQPSTVRLSKERTKQNETVSWNHVMHLKLNPEGLILRKCQAQNVKGQSFTWFTLSRYPAVSNKYEDPFFNSFFYIFVAYRLDFKWGPGSSKWFKFTRTWPGKLDTL